MSKKILGRENLQRVSCIPPMRLEAHSCWPCYVDVFLEHVYEKIINNNRGKTDKSVCVKEVGKRKCEKQEEKVERD